MCASRGLAVYFCILLVWTLELIGLVYLKKGIFLLHWHSCRQICVVVFYFGTSNDAALFLEVSWCISLVRKHACLHNTMLVSV